MHILIVVAVISIVVLGIGLAAFKGSASRRNRTSDLSLETEVDYKARDERIPNLEETLKMYGFPHKEEFLARAAQAPVTASN
ncbi:MAG: hypothetical protein ABSA91_01815 [Acidimicrobiales bacterium]